jgi:hypothetical protein
MGAEYIFWRAEFFSWSGWQKCHYKGKASGEMFVYGLIGWLCVFGFAFLLFWKIPV